MSSRYIYCIYIYIYVHGPKTRYEVLLDEFQSFTKLSQKSETTSGDKSPFSTAGPWRFTGLVMYIRIHP